MPGLVLFNFCSERKGYLRGKGMFITEGKVKSTQQRKPLKKKKKKEIQPTEWKKIFANNATNKA